MNRDDVIRMARESGIEVHPRKDEARIGWDAIAGLDSTPKLERFAALVAEYERQKCCEIIYGQCESDNVAQRTVDAIRARGNP